jgi:hypothetical protein
LRIEFDGYRLQLHKRRRLDEPNFVDFCPDFVEERQRLHGPLFRDIAKAVAALPCKTCISTPRAARSTPRAIRISARSSAIRVVLRSARDRRGRPAPNSADLARRVRLTALLKKAADPVLRLSDTFPNPLKLLAAIDDRGLEGIVTKKSGQPYGSGKNRGWIKVKSHAWRETNRGRGDLLANRRTR